jgi:hypothetical protein
MKKSIFKNTLVAIAVLSLLGAASCKKDSTPSNTGGEAVKSYTVKLGFNDGSIINRCLNITTGVTYNMGDAELNSDKVDIIGGKFVYTPEIQAPSYGAPNSWPRKKGTTMSFFGMKNFDKAAFDAIKTVGQLAELVKNESPGGQEAYVENGDVGLTFPVKTFEGKYAIMRCVRFVGNSSDPNSYFEFDVKTEQ